MRVPLTKNTVVFTKHGVGKIVGPYCNYTTDGLIVEIRGVNHYLAEEDVSVVPLVQLRRVA